MPSARESRLAVQRGHTTRVILRAALYVALFCALPLKVSNSFRVDAKHRAKTGAQISLGDT
jgi:hypothetical protein